MDGTLIAKHDYDAWGNQKMKYLDETGNLVDISSDYLYNDTSILNRFVAYKNPFRYRSYYFDFETGLYYLNSRYYDPEIGRFVNADDLDYADPETLNGLNLYAYCQSNPVNLSDTQGMRGGIG